MKTYTVTISNNFDAESPEDAVSQMVSYLLDNAHKAGYRVQYADALDEPGLFIDAEEQ